MTIADIVKGVTEISIDADKLASSFDTFAIKNRGDAELHSMLSRLGTACRELSKHARSVPPQ